MRHVRSRASQESERMVTSAIRLWTAATFEVAKRKIPGASRFRVSTAARQARRAWSRDRKSTRLNSSHGYISYALFCLKKKKYSHDPRIRDTDQKSAAYR